ncbi:YeiH family protein [Vogesella oryzae]|uniref:YeiH family protein n=1 Tax=Vogesella oryzae TaxID=1735285 RepID=UPI001581E960|nr:putative sulfate exporter family transporter [Vogesella oryzae]
MQKTAYLPGLLAALLLALAAGQLASLPWLAAHGGSALTLAMLGGIVLANLRPLPARWQPGLRLCKQQLLRAGIVLFGLQLTLGQLLQLGGRVLLIDVLVLASTFGMALWLGRKLGLDRDSCVLIGAGSAICGAAAVLATQPVIRASGERASVAVAGVVLFGSIAMLLYPWLYGVLAPLGLNEGAYGVLTGSTMHEVAQVVAAGRAVGEGAAANAVLTKMLRVMLLAPFLLLLAAAWQRRTAQPGARAPITIPWFAFGFIAAIAVNSSGVLVAGLRDSLLMLDRLLLATAMAALGLDTRLAAIRAAGWQPLLLAALLFGWLLLGGGAINWLLQ